MDDGLATITMVSAKTRNALSLSMMSELHTEIDRASNNPEVR
jgi:enoyl-CoA hydratase/carnithine racemase